MTTTLPYIKSQLTDEETRHLIELGICLDYATPYTFSAPYRTSGISIAHVFTLTNLVEIVPKGFVVKSEDNIDSETESLVYLNTYYHPFRGTWIVQYNYISALKDDGVSSNKTLYSTSSVELIDALYQTLLWLLEHGYVEDLTKPRNETKFNQYRPV